jgi:hypothetical protein
LCKVLELVSSFLTSPSSSKMESKYIFYCIFELRGFTGSSLWKVSHISTFGFFLLIFLGVSLHKVSLLFISFSKSPSLPKTEFRC